MPYYFPVYGFEITKQIEFRNFVLFPKTTVFKEAESLAKDRDKFNLTAVGEIKNEPDRDQLFDLAGALTFCQQQWVVLSHPSNFPVDSTPNNAIEKFPPVYKTTNKRLSHGMLIIQDVFDHEARRNFLDLCISRLRDNGFEEATNLRKAFFRNVEICRMSSLFIDVTYYYDFSALEILARTFAQDYTSKNIASIITNFLNNHGFNVDQYNVNSRHLGMQTYTHLRNALFHNGNFEKKIPENGVDVTIKLKDYEGYLRRLMPDVLLKVIGYDDAHINWNRWIDRMTFIE